MKFGVMKGNRATLLEKDLGISIRRNAEGRLVVRYRDKNFKEKSYLCFDEDELVSVILGAICNTCCGEEE